MIVAPALRDERGGQSLQQQHQNRQQSGAYMIEHGQKAQVVKDQHGHRYVMVHGANYNSRGGQANYLGNNHYVQAPMAEYSQDKYAPSHDNYGQSQDNYAPSQEKYGHEEYSLIPDNGEMEITYDHHDPYPQ